MEDGLDFTSVSNFSSGYDYKEFKLDFDPRYQYSCPNCDQWILIRPSSLLGQNWHIPISDRVVGGAIYTGVLLYLLLGTAIYLNKLMESIETMTSLMKRTSISDPETGKTQVIIVKIWNSKVANIFTVIGSSSPMIFLCIVEIFGKSNGPSIGSFTILGSSAFNLLVVIGVIIYAVPKGQVRKLNNLWALIVIAFWYLMLFPWLYSTMVLISTDIIEVWESLIILGFSLAILLSISILYVKVGSLPNQDAAIAEYKANFNHCKLVFERITSQYPGIADNDLLQKVMEGCGGRKPNSWAYYLTKATNKIAGRCVFQNLETSLQKEELATKSFDETGEGITVMNTPNSEFDEELKTKVDRILLKGNSVGTCIGHLWLQQFKNLVNLEHLGPPSPGNRIIHVITWPWKLLAAFIPPASCLGGFVASALCLVAILILTPLIWDIATHLGCFLYCSDALTGFMILSIFFNIPNMMAAKLAAAEEETADLPLICLLTGNCVTVSLGFGLPWLIGSLYSEAMRQKLDNETYRFEIVIYNLAHCIITSFFHDILAFIILFGRRCFTGGELGGNHHSKLVSTIAFFFLWVLLIVQISMVAVGVLNPWFYM